MIILSSSLYILTSSLNILTSSFNNSNVLVKEDRLNLETVSISALMQILTKLNILCDKSSLEKLLTSLNCVSHS